MEVAIAFNKKVTKFLDELIHPLREEIEQLRQIILGSNSDLTENIKWNGPNYCFKGEDRITMKIQPPKQILLVFHRGAKKLVQPKDKLINDKTGLLNWKENDRATVAFSTLREIKKAEADLRVIVRAWLEA
jgi:hypothetical protein